MDIETREVEEGTRIFVRTRKKIALAVREDGEERVYLPETSGEDSTYYVEEVESLTRVEEGYVVVHPGETDSVEVIG